MAQTQVSEANAVTSHNSLWDLNVLDLPANLFSEICDDLNDSQDWSILAGIKVQANI